MRRVHLMLFMVIGTLMGCERLLPERYSTQSKHPQQPHHQKVVLPNDTDLLSSKKIQPPLKQTFLAPELLGGTPLGGKLNGLSLAPPLVHDNLALYPVISGGPLLASTIHTIDTAFKKKKFVVMEEGSGSVPQVSVKKETDEHIYIMTGEMLIGAKQDRISKHDALLPEKKGSFKLPVYCVEQGRWRGNGTFASAKTVSTQKLRKTAAKKQSQSRVWKEVAKKTHQVGAKTPTHTMQASYKSDIYRSKSPEFIEKLSPLTRSYPQSIGVLVAINSQIISLDLFANHHLFADLWEKLLKSYILDAIDPHFQGSEFSASEIPRFLDTLKHTTWTTSQNPGLGTEYLVSSQEVAGTLLVAQNSVIHFALFPEKEGKTRQFEAPAKIGTPDNVAPVSKSESFKIKRKLPKKVKNPSLLRKTQKGK